jgi:hypothetical protein
MEDAGPETRVGPFINENRHLGQRTLYMAISAREGGHAYATFVKQIEAVTRAVQELTK